MYANITMTSKERMTHRIDGLCYFVACAANCDKCDIDETGQCDPDGCASGYYFNSVTKWCHGEWCGVDGCVDLPPK